MLTIYSWCPTVHIQADNLPGLNVSPIISFMQSHFFHLHHWLVIWRKQWHLHPPFLKTLNGYFNQQIESQYLPYVLCFKWDLFIWLVYIPYPTTTSTKKTHEGNEAEPWGNPKHNHPLSRLLTDLLKYRGSQYELELNSSATALLIDFWVIVLLWCVNPHSHGGSLFTLKVDYKMSST